MRSIRFREVNCRNCYKCVRVCPVKSIAVKNEQSRILDEECILCGACLIACPQNAKSLASDLALVRGWIDEGRKVAVTVAPSYAAVFDVPHPAALAPAMKRLGFAAAEETSLGAALVSREYAALMEAGEMKNIISTCCPSVISLVEKYYPALIPALAPVASPMVASARRLKELYGSYAKVVFVGPCISKREECDTMEGVPAVDATLTFAELRAWMEEVGAAFEAPAQASEGAGDEERAIARLYPAPGGVIDTIPKERRGAYDCIAVDGVPRLMEVFNALAAGDLENVFLEANSCVGGCIKGPCMEEPAGGFVNSQRKLRAYYRSAGGGEEPLPPAPDMSRTFRDRSIRREEPDQATIRKILTAIGKPTPDKELNCGCCGYPTCVKKAIAVYQGKAELHMCLPYMRERAESMSNIIVDATPNGILVLNQELQVADMNAAAEQMLSVSRSEAAGRHVFEFLVCDDFEQVLRTGENILEKKCVYPEYGATVYQSVLYLPEHRSLVVILRDVTLEEEQQGRLHKLRAETIESAQRVIDKQMSVAQEIASLLGETTAETKATLTRLQRSMRDEEGAQ